MSTPPPDTVFVCAHGAGGHKDDRGMLAVAKALEATGVEVVRFNFPYRDQGSGRPDAMPVLEATIADVVARVRAERRSARLVIGGRSMGGRAASMLAARGFECHGLLLLAYPLHPAGRPEKLRDAHLGKIHVPVLCVNGTRDALCRRDLMEKTIAGLRNWTMRWIEGADHSFRVLKSSGRADDDVLAEIGRAGGDWLASIPPGRET
jgi:uncharacterized protein